MRTSSVFMLLRLAVIETGNECQLSAQLLLLSNGAIVVGCTEVLFQSSFSLCDVQHVVCGT